MHNVGNLGESLHTNSLILRHGLASDTWTWLSFYLWKVKPLHKVSTKTSLVLGVKLEFNIKTKQCCLLKRNLKIHCFTVFVRSLLMKLLINGIQSLPSRDSLFSIIDKYLKQKHLPQKKYG